MDCTVDTTVIGNSARGDMDSIEILNRIKRSSMIVLDDEGEILDEYSRCIQRAKANKTAAWLLMQAWLASVLDRNARSVNCCLTRNEQDALANLRFDRTDWKFIKTCKHSCSKELIAVESDYNEVVRAHLFENYGITIYNIDQCIQIRKFLD